MSDDLSKEFNQIAKRSDLLKRLAAIRKMVIESEDAIYGFGSEALLRVENLARYAARLPENIKETLTFNIVNASTLKQQVDEIGKLDRLVEYYRQQELRQGQMAENKRLNVLMGVQAGTAIALLFSLILISCIPAKFQTPGQMGLTFFGLTALLGGGGAAIGSVSKRSH